MTGDPAVTGDPCPVCGGSGLVGPAGYETACDAAGDGDAGWWWCDDGPVRFGADPGGFVSVRSAYPEWSERAQ